MSVLVLALMAWVSVATGLPVPADPPTVAFESSESLWSRVYGDQVFDPETDGPILGIYDDATRVIRLPNTWNPYTVRNVSILLHEVVHDLAVQSGREYECQGAEEQEAYETQARFLEAAGMTLADANIVHGEELRLMTMCLPGM
tara:strand:+ start:247 stop:678 length:432 start_codon:yes stop_codon:yes gene_type:complete